MINFEILFIALVAGFLIFTFIDTILIYIASKLVKIKANRKKKDKVYPKDTIILHQFPRGYKAPSGSPFVLKLETWIRMAGLPYQVNKI